jgi:mono/diheme cytochrome c family protein
MTRHTALFAGAGAFMAVASISILAGQQPATPYPPARPQAMAPAGSPARGAQLVMLGGCNDCHTPKLQSGAPDMSRMLSGHPQNAPLAPEVIGGVSANMMLTAWRGPWGVSLSRNLTPDKETGIGSWTLAEFKKTIRTGVDPEGDVLMPPMPIAEIQNLPDQDLDAIYAYLRTIKPIHNLVGRTAPPKK